MEKRLKPVNHKLQIMPKTKTETSLSVIKPELIAEGAPQVINVDLKPFNKAKEQVGLTIAELNKYLVISTKETLDAAMETLKIASKVEKAIENKRKELVEPFNGGAKEINAHAKEITEGLPKAIADVKTAALQFQKDEELRAAKLKKDARIKQLTDMGFEIKYAESDDSFCFCKGGATMYQESLSVPDGLWNSLIARAILKIQDEEAKKLEVLKEEDEDLYDLLGLDEEIEVAKPVLPAPSTSFFAPTKLNGAAKVWKFEVTDSTLVPDEYWVIDESAIRRAVGAGTREIPGVKIYQEDQLRIR